MKITRQDCVGAVNRLARITDKTLVVEYAENSLDYRLALLAGRVCAQFVRWVSPTLPMNAFYDWVCAAIAGIRLSSPNEMIQEKRER